MGVVRGDLFAPSLTDLLVYSLAAPAFALWLFFTHNHSHKINLWLAKSAAFVRLAVALVLFLGQGFYEKRGIYYAREAGYIASLALALVNVADFLWCCPTGYASALLSGAVSMTFGLFAALSEDENARIAWVIMASIVFSYNVVVLYIARHRGDFWAWLVLLSTVAVGICYLVLFIVGHAWLRKLDLVGETWGAVGTDLYFYVILQIIIVALKKSHVLAIKRDDDDSSSHVLHSLVGMPTHWNGPAQYQPQYNTASKIEEEGY